jgi:hypothetical protein
MFRWNRFFEFIAVVIIAILALLQYGTGKSEHNIIAFFIPYQPYNAIIVIALLIVTSRLFAGKPKDYSRFFYLYRNSKC